MAEDDTGGLARLYAGDILNRDQAATGKEEQMRERLAKGEYIFNILKLEGALKALGVVEQ